MCIRDSGPTVGHAPARVSLRAADDATSRLQVCSPSHRRLVTCLVVHDAVVCAHPRVDDGADAAANVLASVERMSTRRRARARRVGIRPGNDSRGNGFARARERDADARGGAGARARSCVVDSRARTRGDGPRRERERRARGNDARAQPGRPRARHTTTEVDDERGARRRGARRRG